MEIGIPNNLGGGLALSRKGKTMAKWKETGS